MISFKNDYSECAHPLVLQNILDNCYEQNNGYSEDRHCKAACDLIRSYLGNVDADIHFLNAGTQTNMTVLDAMLLRPFDAVIAVDSAHICQHETGAIEATGHKILTVPAQDGKILPEDIKDVVTLHGDCHMVHPSVVYISDTTEIGTVYTKAELTAIREVCNECNLMLYVDGARLGSALTSKVNDLTLRDLAWMTDAFSIGGTKNGALNGEAVVITNNLVRKDFRYMMKHRGAMNAKGFVLGMQFEALFTDRLYFRLAEHANTMAEKITEVFSSKGYMFLSRPVSNQVFVVIPNDTVKKLSENFAFEVWGPADENMTIIRFVASWATRDEQIEELNAAVPVFKRPDAE